MIDEHKWWWRRRERHQITYSIHSSDKRKTMYNKHPFDQFEWDRFLVLPKNTFDWRAYIYLHSGSLFLTKPYSRSNHGTIEQCQFLECLHIREWCSFGHICVKTEWNSSFAQSMFIFVSNQSFIVGYSMCGWYYKMDRCSKLVHGERFEW